MKKMSIYTEDNEDTPSLKVVRVDIDDPPGDGWTIQSDISVINEMLHNGEYDYKTIRDCMKSCVVTDGENDVLSTETDPSVLTPSEGDKYLIGVGAVGVWLDKDGQVAKWISAAWVYVSTEENGFDGLSTSPIDRKTIASTHKIGTSLQRRNVLTDLEERDYLYLSYDEKLGNVRPNRMGMIKMLIFSRISHEYLAAAQMNADAYIYGLVTLTKDLIVAYENVGIEGKAKGDQLEGIYDFTNETVGTSFQPNGPSSIGLVSNPLLAPLVPDGFDDIQDYANAIMNILDYGF
jgi:hypothetical protein